MKINLQYLYFIIQKIVEKAIKIDTYIRCYTEKEAVVYFSQNIVIEVTMFGKKVHCYSINNMIL